MLFVCGQGVSTASSERLEQNKLGTHSERFNFELKNLRSITLPLDFQLRCALIVYDLRKINPRINN